MGVFVCVCTIPKTLNFKHQEEIFTIQQNHQSKEPPCLYTKLMYSHWNKRTHLLQFKNTFSCPTCKPHTYLSLLNNCPVCKSITWEVHLFIFIRLIAILYYWLSNYLDFVYVNNITNISEKIISGDVCTTMHTHLQVVEQAVRTRLLLH